MRRPSPALVAKWYARLRATGFRDIEGGRDLNAMDAWTFRGGDGTHGPAVTSWPDGFEPSAPLADHPTAVYHRELAHAARALKGRRRALVLIASEGNTAQTGRRLHVSQQTVSKQVRRFAQSIGLLREVHGS